MALNKDTLGTALYNMADAFNDQDIAPADMEARRLEFWKGVADEVIKHFKTLGVVTTTGTATNHTGTIA